MLRSVLVASVIFASASAMFAPAQATVLTSFGPGLATPDAGFTVVDDFNGPDAAASVTGSNYLILPATIPDVGAAPANSSPSGTPFLAVQAGGSATYSFTPGVTAFQFDWGSVDAYNTLTVNYLLNGQSLSQDFVPGTAGFLLPANGNQSTANTNGRFTVSGDAGELFSSVTFADKNFNAFEVDNIAVAGAVPEPATWAMMLVGFGVVGAGMRQRRKAPSFA